VSRLPTEHTGVEDVMQMNELLFPPTGAARDLSSQSTDRDSQTPQDEAAESYDRPMAGAEFDNWLLAPGPVVQYRLTDEAWEGYTEHLQQLILRHGGRTVCDVGGGANPSLDQTFVDRHGLDYVIVDISAEELAKAPAGYRKRQMDVAQPLSGEEGTYDFVFSKFVAEHVRDAGTFHRNMYRLLRPGGIAFHFFPTLYAPPFVVNYLLPESVSYPLLRLIQRHREKEGRGGKFPAYYAWCTGPNRRAIRRLESTGFSVKKYIGFYGHDHYYEKFPSIAACHNRLAAVLQRHPIACLTSFAYLILQKPLD